MDLDDLLSEPVTVNARAGVKFQPKGRPKCKVKGTVLPTPSRLDSSKDKPVTADVSKSVVHLAPLAEAIAGNFQLSTADTPVEMPCSSALLDSSSQPVIQHHVNHTGALFQEVSASDGDRTSAPVDVSPQFGTIGEDIASSDPSFVRVTNNGDKQAGFGRSRVETADIFSDLESLDDILPQPAMTNGTVGKKFQPKVKVNSEPINKLLISRPVASEADLESLASVAPNPNASTAPEKNNNPDIVEVPQEVLNNGEAAAAAGTYGVSWVDDMRLEREEETFGGFNSQDAAAGNSFLIHSANESLEEEEDLSPIYPSDSFIDSSNAEFSNSVPRDTPQEQVTDELESFAEKSYPKVVDREEFVDSQAGHVITGEEDERSVFTASNRNGNAKSSRLQRNEVSPPVASHGLAEETRENQHLLSEPPDDSLVNADDNNENSIGEEAPISKRTRKNSKNPVSASEKTGRRRKKADGPDSSDKEPPKKKFSHSSRRNRRKVDQDLLNNPTPNYRNLPLKDLILLAEAKERLASKDPNVAKNSFPNQSNTQDTSFGEEDSFGLRADSFGLRDDSFGLPEDSFGLRDDSFGYQDDEQAAPSVPSVQPKLNYHTFMNRTSKVRWSQQDTELFYEGIRQFGTDFAMIQQLFPGRTRHQVKLKYKKEERQYPMRLSDALTDRSKNHSHFELVIEKLKAAAEADAEQNRDDESIGLTGEEEEVTPDTNEEVTQNKNQEKLEEEMGEGRMEAEEAATINHQGYSPVKCHEESEEEDVYDMWSEYKSDI